MKRYVKSSSINNGIVLYRVGDIDGMSSSPYGLFFATKLSYYDYNDCLGYLAEKAHKYLLLPNADIWDPASEFELFEINSWSNILCMESDLNKYGMEDECDYELDERFGVTSTDGLALAGKKLGYDAMLLRGIWYGGEHFDEYAVYNPSVLKPI